MPGGPGAEGLEERRSVGGGGQGEDQPAWSEGAQGLLGLGDRKDEILCRPSHRGKASFPTFALRFIFLVSFLQSGGILVSPFPDSASCLNNQKLMGMSCLSRKK